MRDIAIDFQFIDDISTHYFSVQPIGDTTKIFEYFDFNTDREEKSLKLEIRRTDWDAIKHHIKSEFNIRLKSKKACPGRLSDKREVFFCKEFGKELVLLAWSIHPNGANLSTINNWIALAPEERWWLYMMANSNQNWRSACQLALQ